MTCYSGEHTDSTWNMAVTHCETSSNSNQRIIIIWSTASIDSFACSLSCSMLCTFAALWKSQNFTFTEFTGKIVDDDSLVGWSETEWLKFVKILVYWLNWLTEYNLTRTGFYWNQKQTFVEWFWKFIELSVQNSLDNISNITYNIHNMKYKIVDFNLVSRIEIWKLEYFPQKIIREINFSITER